MKKNKKEMLSIFAYTAAGFLVGGVVWGTLVMNLKKPQQQQQTAQPVAAEAVRADLAAETQPVQTFPVTTMTFTVTTTTTTLTTTTTTTTTPPPPPLDAMAVSAVLTPAKEALSMKYHYSDTDTYEYYSEWGGWRIPFTTESARYSYEGVITVGIDPAKIEMSIDNYTHLITIKLPQPEILSNELDEDSIRFYDVQSPLFGGSGMEDYRGIIKGLKDKQSAKVMRDTAFLSEVSANAENVVRTYLMQAEKTAMFGVKFGELPKQDGVTFDFLPYGEAQPTVPTEPAEPELPEEEPDPDYVPMPDYPDADILPLPEDTIDEQEIPDVPDEGEYEPEEEENNGFDAWSADPTASYQF